MFTNTTTDTIGQVALLECADPIRDQVKRAFAGFLAGYSGTTVETYRLDLRQWLAWPDTFHTDVFAVERAHIEMYARWAESEGKAKATIGRRLSTIWTATNLVLSLSRRDCRADATTPSPACWR